MENWSRYHPTSALADGEAAVQVDLNEHITLQRIEDPRSLPLLTNIMSHPAQ